MGSEMCIRDSSYVDGAAFFAQGSEVGLQEELPEFRRECAGVVEDLPPEGLQKVSMPAPSFSRPKPVLTIDCRCEKTRPSLPPSLPAPDNAFRELMMSRITCESNSSSGRELGTLQFSGSVELAATTAAADSESEARSFTGNLAVTRSHVTSSPGARGAARRLRAATDTPPEWRHADDALS